MSLSGPQRGCDSHSGQRQRQLASRFRLRPRVGVALPVSETWPPGRNTARLSAVRFAELLLRAVELRHGDAVVGRHRGAGYERRSDSWRGTACGEGGRVRGVVVVRRALRPLRFRWGSARASVIKCRETPGGCGHRAGRADATHSRVAGAVHALGAAVQSCAGRPPVAWRVTVARPAVWRA